MDRLLKQSLLYDFYGELLTERQRSVYEAFAFEDLSLGELAEQEGISRQGVHDLVRRCEKALQGYEERLHLVERFGRMKEGLAEIQALAGAEERDSKPLSEPERLRKIREIAGQLSEEL